MVIDYGMTCKGGLVARAIAARCNLPFKVLTVTTFVRPIILSKNGKSRFAQKNDLGPDGDLDETAMGRVGDWWVTSNNPSRGQNYDTFDGVT